MRIKDIIRAKKTNIRWGDWSSGVKMPRTQFPLSKGSSFRVRSGYNWNVSTFECLNQSFRLLVFYRMDKQEYGAWLGLIDGKDTKVIARLEFHAFHGGWHMHTNCETDDSPIGRTGGNSYMRIPKSHDQDRRSDFDVADNEKALYIAAKKYGLTGDNTGLFGHGH